MRSNFGREWCESDEVHFLFRAWCGGARSALDCVRLAAAFGHGSLLPARGLFSRPGTWSPIGPLFPQQAATSQSGGKPHQSKMLRTPPHQASAQKNKRSGSSPLLDSNEKGATPPGVAPVSLQHHEHSRYFFLNVPLRNGSPYTFSKLLITWNWPVGSVSPM